MMKQCGRILAPAIALGVVVAFAPRVLASPIVYDASGTFDKGAFTLGGTVTLDPSDTTYIANFDLTVSVTGGAQVLGPPTLTSGIFSASNTTTEIGATYLDSSSLGLIFDTTDLQAGGVIDLLFNPPAANKKAGPAPPPLGYLDSEGDRSNIDSGALLTPSSAPEPASLTLLAAGFVAIGGFGLYRRRPEAAGSSQAC
jgi:hypothetical protein